MTPQDQQFIEARIDARLADMRGDVRVNTQGLSDLKSRFEQFATKMDTVPADIAVLKERISHLPTKGWMVTSLITSLTVIAALVAFAEKLHSLVK